MDSEDPMFILYTSGTTGAPKGSCIPAGGTWSVSIIPPSTSSISRRATCMVYCRSRLDHRALLCSLRAALGRGDHPDLREHARLSRSRDLVEDGRGVRREHPLHRPDRHPHVHETGGGVAGQVQPLIPAHPRLRGRAAEPGGLRMVLPCDRQGQVPDRGHLVADRDRHAHDHDRARGTHAARLLPASRSPVLLSMWWTRMAKAVDPGQSGLLVIKEPWPAMMRTVWNNDERYRKYWESVPGCYLVGDLAIKGPDGNIMVIGRSDDLIVVAGHNIGTAEVESALVSHKAVAEAAVIGKPDPLKGNTIKAFVTLRWVIRPATSSKTSSSTMCGSRSAPSPCPRRSSSWTPSQRPAAARLSAVSSRQKRWAWTPGRLDARRISDGSKPNFLNTVLWHL